MSNATKAMLPFPHDHDNDLLYLSTLAIEGKDASAFLQGQLTQDVSLCTQGPQMAAALNPKGRAYALGWLVSIPTGFLWVLPQTILSTTLTNLKRYVLRSQVTLTDVSDIWHVTLSTTASNLDGLPCLPAALQTKTGWFGVLHKTPPNPPPTIWLNWHARCLSVGYPMLTPATVEQYTAHELDLISWQGVSFTKGCYTGQEIVARMHYRATPKTALTLVSIDAWTHAHIGYGDSLVSEVSGQTIDLVDGQWLSASRLLALSVLPHTLPDTSLVSHASGAQGRLIRENILHR